MSDTPKPNKVKKTILVIVILILAVLAGVGGAVLTNFSIFPYLAKVPYFQKFMVADDEGRTIFKIVEKEKEIVSEDDAIYGVIDSNKESIVTVVATEVSGLAPTSLIGTGFIVSADGLIVTNKHLVLDSTARVKVIRNDYSVADVEVVGRDALNDLALLKIKGDNLPVANLYPREEIKLGQRVIALGSKYERRDNFVSMGVLSSVNKGVLLANQTPLSRMEGLLETDALVLTENSGGPLTNLNGEVIGMTAKIGETAEEGGYAIPVSLIRSAIDSYIEHGFIRRSSLGVQWETITPGMAQVEGLDRWEGALLVPSATVAAVIPGGPAAKAGLKARDIIHKINGEQIDLDHGFMRMLQQYEPGTEIEVTYVRNNKDKTVKIKVGESK